MKIGYARVSTQEQSLNLQIDILKKAGCEIVFEEKISGKNLERSELKKMISTIRKDDEIIVWKLDRLARSLKNLIELVNLFKEKGVIFISIEDSINTKTAIGKFTFHLFGALAEFERNLIAERTKIGLQFAKEKGRIGGRPKGISQKNQILANAVKVMFDDEKMSMTDIAKKIDRSRVTCYRYYNYVTNKNKIKL